MGQASVIVPTECTAQLRNGKFCHFPGMEGAPFPLCNAHVREVYVFGAAIVQKALAEPAKRNPSRREPSTSTAGDPLVYYLLVGELIKIGFTRDLKARMTAYPPDSKLLAVERDPYAGLLEKRRHAQFAHNLRHGAEWFATAPDLLAFIDSLRDASRSGSRDGCHQDPRRDAAALDR